jgi:hypothetical protein
MESLPKPRDEDLETLCEVIALGAPVIGVFSNGASIAKDHDFPEAFTDDVKTIQSLMMGHGDQQGRAKGQVIECFRFCPAKAGLLCLDIDRGHGNKTDGLVEFYRLWESIGKPRWTLPDLLQDIEHGSFPVYTTTPRGGYHLYFRYPGPEVKKGLLAPNVEVFHSHAYLTAPGSRKGDRAYVLHGHLADAPPIPPILDRRLPYVGTDKPTRAIFHFEPNREKRIPSLDQLAAWAEQDRSYSGKNELCHAIALRAAREEYPYSTEEVIAFLSSYTSTTGHKQIKSAVRSAFHYMKKYERRHQTDHTVL